MTSRAAALRYARALFDVAQKEADVQQVQAQLEAFAALVTANPALAKLLLLLASRDRLALLPDLAAAYRERVLDHLQVIRGEVRSAMPLAADRLTALEQSLARATGRRVVLEAKVDPAIIGGVVTRLGSTVFDGSVTTQLEKLKQTLVEGGI